MLSETEMDDLRWKSELTGGAVPVRPEELRELLDEIASLRGEVDRCHARLEIDHRLTLPEDPACYELVRVYIPYAQRDLSGDADAVACRDVTIALQNDDIAALEREARIGRAVLGAFDQAVQDLGPRTHPSERDMTLAKAVDMAAFDLNERGEYYGLISERILLAIAEAMEDTP